MTTKLESIELIIVRVDENGREHSIKAVVTAEYGYQQWGASTDVLGDNVELLTAIADAVQGEPS